MTFKYKRKLANTLSELLIRTLRLNSGNKLNSILQTRLNPIYDIPSDSGPIHFHCPNEIIHWRLESFYEKEPETIKWINSFANSDVLYDVGANIGTFSLYAAKRGLAVIAFEPEALNYAELWRNLVNNDAKSVHAYNIALGSQAGFINLTPSAITAGAANHTTSQDMTANTGKLSQFVYSERLDTFIDKNDIPFPTHIKIDVDGFESLIIDGMPEALKDQRLKSVLIEINENNKNDQEIIPKMELNGFRIESKTSSHHKINNYIFSRR